MGAAASIDNGSLFRRAIRTMYNNNTERAQVNEMRPAGGPMPAAGMTRLSGKEDVKIFLDGKLEKWQADMCTQMDKLSDVDAMHIKLATDYARHQVLERQDIGTLAHDQIEKMVQEQVKAIMSDSNFPFDKIMNNLTQEIESKDIENTYNLVQYLDVNELVFDADYRTYDLVQYLNEFFVDAEREHAEEIDAEHTENLIQCLNEFFVDVEDEANDLMEHCSKNIDGGIIRLKLNM